jgi:sugar/nucleoside kinase (ribokinase family)
LSSNSGEGGKRPVVLCAGITVEDFIFKVERFPAPGEKLHAESLLAITGGCAANAAVAVARLGGIACFAGPVGTDDASRRIIAGLMQAGVDVSGVERVEGGSVSVSGIFIDGAGEKMVATRRGEKLANARPRDAQALIADIDVVMADNRFPDFVQPICEAARARGIPVIVDGDRATQLDDPLFAIATHVVFSSEALRATAGCSDLAAALRSAAATIDGFLAVTNGPDEVLWMEDGAVRAMPVFAVEAIDTLGAGDTFHGAFAMALAEGRDAVAAMRFAAAAAALKCTRFGGISGTPLRTEVEAFLAARAPDLK